MKQYAQIAKKAIISKEDYNQYEAIRELSDIKENPSSTAEEIAAAEEKLNQVSAAISYASEGSKLSRMNWWTAEYGLVGDINNPKIYGAGLLSSVGESKWCLSERVKKIPLTLDCIEQSYDITEPQPQLFVANSFKHLSDVLEELSETMAYKTGGIDGLTKAIKAESINTVEFENSLQVSGALKKFFTEGKKVSYLQFEGPTQISYNNKQIEGHSKDYHSSGYGTPVGPIKNFNLENLKLGSTTELHYESGVKVTGILKTVLRPGKDAVVLTFENATCDYKGKILFQPEWGNYDVVLANNIVSVFGGPADRGAYGAVDDFVASRVPTPKYSEKQLKLFKNYQAVRDLRTSGTYSTEAVTKLFNEFKNEVPNEWLLFLELLEMTVKKDLSPDLIKNLDAHLQSLTNQSESVAINITAGLKLAYEKF